MDTIAGSHRENDVYWQDINRLTWWSCTRILLMTLRRFVGLTAARSLCCTGANVENGAAPSPQDLTSGTVSSHQRHHRLKTPDQDFQISFLFYFSTTYLLNGLFLKGAVSNFWESLFSTVDNWNQCQLTHPARVDVSLS